MLVPPWFSAASTWTYGAGRREPREAKYNMSMKVYQAGIDIGSTTVKLVVTDEEGRTLFSDYRRHCARTQETLADLLRDVRGRLGSCCLRVGMTGSGALSLADALHVTFEQEVVPALRPLPRPPARDLRAGGRGSGRSAGSCRTGHGCGH